VEDHNENQHPIEGYLRVVWRRKWMIVLLVLISTSAVVIGGFLMTPVYEASATLRIQEQRPSLLGGETLSSGVSVLTSKEEMNTQIEILKSRSVLEEVIVQLDLVDRFEIAGELSPEERLLAALNRLKETVSVTDIVNTQLIRIAVRSSHPGLARDVVNTLSQVYIGRNVESKRANANAVLAFVSGQVDQVSERLKRAEEQLLGYKQSEGIGVLSEEARLKVDRLAAIESSYQETRVAREVLGARRGALLDQMSPSVSPPGSRAITSNTPAIREMQGRLADFQTELSSLGQVSTSNSRRASELKAAIDSLQNDIKAEIERIRSPGNAASVETALRMQLAEYESQDVILAAQEEAWLNLIRIHEEGINRYSAREIDLMRLERNRKINEELYAALMRAKNEAGIEAASQIGNIDIIDPAVMPLKPVLPKKRQNGVVALVASLLMALLLSFLIEHLDRSLKSEEELKKLLDVPVLGLIPRFDTTGRRNGLVNGNGAADRLVTRDEPHSPVSEAFRLLRANLRFVEVDGTLKTIMVTSPTPGDGKTTIVANLSVELAAREDKVLVVDTDFKIPAVHRIFNLSQHPGVSDVLTKGTGFRTVLQRVEGVPNLHVMTAGPIPPNSSELLGSSRMKKLMEELGNEYERIIFDVPPVLAATDPLDLACDLDGVLVVLKAGETDRRAILRMRDILDNTRIRIIGSILNAVDTRDGTYRYSQYYYHYHYDYGARKQSG
jgi:tyrosine-protein kinase Etk/Wzc